MSASPLHDIAALLARAEDLSPEAQTVVRDQIQGVRRTMREAPSELLGCLDAAATLVNSLAHLEPRAATEVQEMVARLVDLVAGAKAGEEAQEASAPSPPAEETPAEEPQAELELASTAPEPGGHPLSPTPGELAEDPFPVREPDIEPTFELESELEPDIQPTLELESEPESEPTHQPEPEPAHEPAPSHAPPIEHAAPVAMPAVSGGDVDYSVPKLNDMMLGEVMIQLGFVSKGEVDTALGRMAERGERFGQALIEIGAATAEDVAQGISLQRLLSQGAQQAAQENEQKFERANVLHGILLGEILVLMGRITREQLKQGLEHQRFTGSRIGEALVELRFITWNDLDEAIRIQHARGGSSELNESSTVIDLD